MQRRDKIRKLESDLFLGAEFEKIYNENFNRLFLFACKITRSREIARDVVSDIFVELWDKRLQLEQIKEIESYLFISVKNHAIRMVSRNVDQGLDSIEDTMINIDRIDPEEILLEKELYKLIEQTVNALPDQCQLVFRLAKDKKMKYKEIAEELGISITTVKSQLLKATTRIKEAILESYGGHHDTIGYDQLGIILLTIISGWILH